MKMCQWPAEVAAFTEFIRTEGVRNVLEIGTGPGGFISHLGDVCLGPVLMSVDLPNANDATGLSSAQCQARDRELKRRHPHFISILGDSHSTDVQQRVKDALGPHQVDLLFLDGDDTFRGKLQDRKDYHKFVSPGGIIATHDIVSYGLCGVPEFWRLLIRPHREKYEFVEPGHPWGGIGAWRVR